MNGPVLPESAVNPLDFLPDPLPADMDALDCLIHEQLRSDAGLITQVGEHIINAGGKRIRPLLVLLMARMMGYRGTDHHILAAIIEFIHTASLLHDDVVDESMLRRGVESANARFGNAASVLVGDFMHTRAFQMMLSVNDRRVMEILAQATNTIAEGEVMQLMSIRQADMDEAAYCRIIYAKTAKLFEAASVLGAVITSPSERYLAAATAYGRSLGMAFQLIDDCLDYAGDASTLGKNTGNDLREGKMTLPLIRLMQRGTDRDRERVRDYIINDAAIYFDDIINAVRQSDALEYTAQKAADTAREALAALEIFPDNEYRTRLMQLCRFAIKRTY
ncbi:polyprenyl synthetase family protein [Oxalobacter sp. OttesenSCG-928-P03]|nr:polyprenyl synthetase family protein [Oxalobacter sp. OttesenSCG-928-P03]